jgi:hypothetical protein
MTTQEYNTNKHSEFCSSVDQHIISNRHVLSRKYVQGRYIRGLFALAKTRLKPKTVRVKAHRRDIVAAGGVIGKYDSVKIEGKFNQDKYYMINLRNHSTDIKFNNEYNVQESLIAHLDEYFSKAGYPEFIFLVDSAFSHGLGNQYLNAGYSYAFIANIVKSDDLPCGVTILTRKVLTPEIINSITLVPYSNGYVNNSLFRGDKIFEEISLYSAAFIQDSQGEYVGAFHQPAVEERHLRTAENIVQIDLMNKASKPIKVLMMDSNKYGVNTKDYRTRSRFFKSLMLNHPIYDFIPALLDKSRGVSVNTEEIEDAKNSIKSSFSNYSIIHPIHHSDPYAKTFHGQHKSIAEKVFANIIKYCLDIAIVDNTRKWFIHHNFPRSSKFQNFFTDHSGILVEGVKK